MSTKSREATRHAIVAEPVTLEKFRRTPRGGTRRRRKVRLNHVDVPITGLPPILAGLSLAHVSDLHYRRWNRVLDEVGSILADLPFEHLFFTGDIAASPDRWREALEAVHRLTEPLWNRTGIWAVLGNHDHLAMSQTTDSPIRFLNNESFDVRHSGTEIEVAGVTQTRLVDEDLGAALATGRRRDLAILAAHYPSTVFRLPPGRVNLLLAGHTHGGQIRLPGLGCVWTNDRLPRRMSRGLHRVADTFVHISPGIGVSRLLPLRVNCSPEVTLLTLRTGAAPRPRERGTE